MKNFKKIFICLFALIFANSVHALEIVDVNANHWAGQAIIFSIQNGYIHIIDNNKFVPEGTMTRGEFVDSLLKVVRKQNIPVVQKTTFKDIKATTPNKRSITLSEQIRMAFGYPNKMFRPSTAINHNEVMNLVANITTNDYVAGDITRFKDWKKIPIWARRAYIKNVANDLYVNYPDELTFNPTQKLTRAEAAVLFEKIAQNLDKVKMQYREYAYNPYDFDKANFIAQNTLALAPFPTESNNVQIYDLKKIIDGGNLLVATSTNITLSKKDKVGNEYVFVAPNDVYTKEGTFLYPKGTEFYARTENLDYSSWRSRPEKSLMVFYKYSMPTGETYDMAGVPYTVKNKIVYIKPNEKAKNKNFNEFKGSQKDHIISVAHQFAPKIKYDLKENKTFYILLTADMVLPVSDDYFKLRTKKSLLEDL